MPPCKTYYEICPDNAFKCPKFNRVVTVFSLVLGAVFEPLLISLWF